MRLQLRLLSHVGFMPQIIAEEVHSNRQAGRYQCGSGKEKEEPRSSGASAKHNVRNEECSFSFLVFVLIYKYHRHRRGRRTENDTP